MGRRRDVSKNGDDFQHHRWDGAASSETGTENMSKKLKKKTYENMLEGHKQQILPPVDNGIQHRNHR